MKKCESRMQKSGAKSIRRRVVAWAIRPETVRFIASGFLASKSGRDLSIEKLIILPENQL
jgi:hypothetical protein